jgi:DNA-binding MarR family transcriptional regulator
MLPAHYALLVSVRSNPRATGAKLAPLLGVTHQNVSGLVARLTVKGWLHRRTQQGHPQVLELHLTDEGVDRLAHADRLLASFETRVATTLGQNQTAALLTGLEHLRTAAEHCHQESGL